MLHSSGPGSRIACCGGGNDCEGVDPLKEAASLTQAGEELPRPVFLLTLHWTVSRPLKQALKLEGPRKRKKGAGCVASVCACFPDKSFSPGEGALGWSVGTGYSSLGGLATL